MLLSAFVRYQNDQQWAQDVQGEPSRISKKEKQALPLPRSPASGLLALTHLHSAPPISSSRGFPRSISVASSTWPSSLNFIAVKCSIRKAVGRPTCPSGPRASLLQVRGRKTCVLGPCSVLGRWMQSVTPGARGLAGHGVWETQVPLVQTATRSKGPHTAGTQ